MIHKRQISPNNAKIISSVLIAIPIISIMLSLCSSLIKSTLRESRKEYVEHYSNVTQSYKKAVNIYLENYITAIDAYYVEEHYNSDKNIHDFLISSINIRERLTPEFEEIFYINPQYTLFSQNGEILDVSQREYARKILEEKLPYYLTDPVKSHISDKPVIIIAKAIYNSEKDLIGALGAAIPLESLTKIFTNLSVSRNSNLHILDSKGKFIIHEDQNWINKEFDSAIYKKKSISGSQLVERKAGNLKTIDVYNRPISLFFTPIDNTNWTLTLSLHDNHDVEIINKYKTRMLMVIIAAFIVLILMLLAEYYILDYFQRHQIIATVYDPLTNLWTREYFEKEASRQLHLFPKSKFMLIESDIRNFKFLNENYGEEIANKILSDYAAILSKYTKVNKGMISRGFADRFYILYRISSIHKAMNVFKDTLDILNNELLDYDYPFFPKFGITFLLPDRKRDITIQGLIGQASFAKSTIKDNMMVQYSIYNSRLLKKVNEEQFIEQHMQHALDNNEFFVMYQPKMDLATDKISGAEALVRWKSPELGLLSPDQFIPLFEKNGFITKLDFFVYEEVFKFLQKQINEGNPVVPISVNMSRNHTKPDRFISKFMNVFNKYSIPPEYVQIEILERSFADSGTLKEITAVLHKEGFTVAMDDFGKGESSLNMLTQIPVDILKFDRDFLQSSTSSSGIIEDKAAGFIQILINLSKHLNKETVFEGVETQSQKDFLRDIKCDQAQGFFYSKPLVQEDFIQFTKMHM